MPALFDYTAAIEEEAEYNIKIVNITTTFTQGLLFFKNGASVALFDITGKKVLELKPGNNNVNNLAPGVYFLPLADDGKGTAQKKIILN